MDLSKLQKTINYQFKEIDLLTRALSHRSYLNESKTKVSNERLEFLGDAVLELAITEFLFFERPEEPEGVLTAARSAIVRTETLAELAEKLHFGDHLLMSKGEETSGGRTNTSLLANTTEAIIGAIYLDGGYVPAKQFIDKHLVPAAKRILKKGSLKDPKSLLQEKVQYKGYESPHYETVSEEGPDHNKTFTVQVVVGGHKLATGTGPNKQAAQQSAAQKALPKVPTLASIR